MDEPLLACQLCNRPFPRRHLTEHHCKPKEKGGTRDDVELLCSQCHGMVHTTYVNATLAVLYPTIGRLRLAPALQPFLRWVRKQPPSRRRREIGEAYAQGNDIAAIQELWGIQRSTVIQHLTDYARAGHPLLPRLL